MKWTLELLDACLKHGLYIPTDDPDTLALLSCMKIYTCSGCPLYSNVGCGEPRQDPALLTIAQTHYPELLI